MYREELRSALTQIDPDLIQRFVDRSRWDEAVIHACARIVSRQLQGEAVNYVRRAAQQLDQRGFVDFYDEPTGETSRVPTRQEIAAAKRARWAEQVKPLELTEKRQKQILAPGFTAKLGATVRSTLLYATDRKEIPEGRDFTVGSIGLYLGGPVANARVMNSMIRNGIVVVTNRTENVDTCTFRWGPNYRHFVEVSRQEHEADIARRAAENPSWGGPEETPDFDAIPGVGMPISVLFQSGHHETVRVLHGYSVHAMEKARKVSGDLTPIVGMKKWPDQENYS